MSFGKSVSRGFRAMKNLIFVCVLLVLCLMMSALVSSRGQFHHYSFLSGGQLGGNQSLSINCSLSRKRSSKFRKKLISFTFAHESALVLKQSKPPCFFELLQNICFLFSERRYLFLLTASIIKNGISLPLSYFCTALVWGIFGKCS